MEYCRVFSRGVYVVIASFLCMVVLKSGVKADRSRCPSAVRSMPNIYTFQNTCYRFVNTEKYWDEALKDCQSHGGTLVAIYNKETQEFLMTILGNWRGFNGVWIGANDKENEGSWYWTGTGGRTLDSYKYWNEGEPESHSLLPLTDCAAMKRPDGWKWGNYPCESWPYTYRYFCMYDMLPTTTTTTSTTTTTTTSTTSPPTTSTTTTVPPTTTTTATKRQTVAPTAISSIASSVPSTAATKTDVKFPSSTTTEAFKPGGARAGSFKADNQQPNDSTGLLVGMSFVGIFIIVLVILIVVYIYRRRIRALKQKWSENNNSNDEPSVEYNEYSVDLNAQFANPLYLEQQPSPPQTEPLYAEPTPRPPEAAATMHADACAIYAVPDECPYDELKPPRPVVKCADVTDDGGKDFDGNADNAARYITMDHARQMRENSQDV